jgi:hypothetical protein
MAKGKATWLERSKKISEESLSNDALRMVDRKEAVIPQEAIIDQDPEKNDYQNHPKFSKFKKAGGQ